MRNKEELIQVLPLALEEREFQGVRTRQAEQTNLSNRLNDFVGQDQEQGTILEALQNTRGFVTLLGAGGTVKPVSPRKLENRRLGSGRAEFGLWTCPNPTAKPR